VLTGCETTVSTRLPEEPIPSNSVILTPGDVVKVTFPGQPDYNQAQKIEADGRINLPLVGEVTASGRTIASLQRQLQALYGSQLANSEVVVSLDSKVSQVVIAGAVQKPAKYVFDRPTTVFQAVMEAGGPDQYGTLAKVKLTRLVNGQQQTQVFDLRPIVRGEAVRPVYVRAGDVIVVGQNPF
jgi:polysaccharide export outer membrane protein